MVVSRKSRLARAGLILRPEAFPRQRIFRMAWSITYCLFIYSGGRADLHCHRPFAGAFALRGRIDDPHLGYEVAHHRIIDMLRLETFFVDRFQRNPGGQQIFQG